MKKTQIANCPDLQKQKQKNKKLPKKINKWVNEWENEFFIYVLHSPSPVCPLQEKKKTQIFRQMNLLLDYANSVSFFR